MKLGNSFLHTVSQPLEKHLARKPHHNRKDVFLCFVVKFFNSTVSKDCFSRQKETAQFSYMIWRE